MRSPRPVPSCHGYALGRPPDTDVKVLRQRVDDAGLQDVDMKISLVLGSAQEFPGDSGYVRDAGGEFRYP